MSIFYLSEPNLCSLKIILTGTTYLKRFQYNSLGQWFSRASGESFLTELPKFKFLIRQFEINFKNIFCFYHAKEISGKFQGIDPLRFLLIFNTDSCFIVTILH